MDLCEFEDSLIYRVSSWIARNIQREREKKAKITGGQANGSVGKNTHYPV